MKLIVLMSLLLASANVLACQCEIDENDYIDPGPVVERLIKKSLGEGIEMKKNEYGYPTKEWIKAYPNLMDRQFARDNIGTSCENIGPNGEVLLPCKTKTKDDYRYILVKADGSECTADVQLKVAPKKVGAKLLKTTCR